MKKLFILFGTILGLVLVACAPAAAPTPAPGEKKEAPAAQPAEKPIYGGIIRFRNYSTPPTLDPHRTLIGAFTSSGHGIAYSRLLHYNVGPKQVGYSYAVSPDLAESWKQLDDITWEFKIRKGMKFHNLPPVNGREVVADDIIYSYKRQMTPGWDNAGLLDTIAKLEAPDKYTLRITLKKPDSDILAILADGHAKLVAKELVEAQNNDLKDGPTISAGPFIVTEYQKDVIIKFKKNPDFYLKDAQGNQLPYVDGLESYIIRDDAARFAAFRAKRLDYETVYPAWKEQLEKENHPAVGTIIPEKTASGKQFGLRADKAPFTDVRVRQAVMVGWNREDLKKSVYRGMAWYTPVAYISGLDAVLPEEETLSKYYKHDPALAKKLLADAGYPTGFKTTFTVANYGNDYVSQAQLMVEQWKEVGIDVEIKVIEPQVYTQRILVEGNFDMFMGPYTPVPGANVFLWTNYHTQSKERNVSRVNSPKLDKIIDDQMKEADVAKRNKLLWEAQRLILEDASNYNSVAGYSLVAHWPYIRYVRGSGSYEYMNLANMWLNPDDPTYKGRP